ncbi:TonB-dependent receptor [Niabella yanshanensis]|uniref:TonB-dependent receptor n=1 Tax=Niabella yanshanensis TaxID=577386 RepID=A0ABZ0WCX9_9BACT|nr:TonB-dependent receptor [Niabella yanshanensis]WQD40515.1 TonB-dependent receptor [Niabella yanshanensis]
MSLVANFFAIALGAQDTGGIRGWVEDTQGKPLQFATAKLNLDGVEIASKTTDASGMFEFSTDFLRLDSVTLEVSYVNKATQTIVLKKANYASVIKMTLPNLSLTLNDVVVTGTVKNQNSASSIVFDEEAIRQLQAFSLMDVLNTLPGKKTEAPNLQSPQTINLRTSASDADAINNSFGIAVFIDGVRVSNETNMQSRGLSSRGLGGSLLNAQGETAMDVTYNGFDLRDIPMSNIASIEVIQGIGSARYGDFTNGAILITTKAGKAPYSFTTNINGGSSSFSLTKGLSLGEKAGAVNFSIGYLNSNDDPRDKLKSYDNFNASLKWTKNFSKVVTNSLTINGESNLDDIKADPDDDDRVMSYSKRRNLRISNNTTFNFNKRFFNTASVLLNYSQGKQYTYSQMLFNQPPKGIGYKDTTGIYEGVFIPGNYLAVEEIDGKPIAYSANIDMQTNLLPTAGLQHQLSFGFAFNTSGNTGLGYIVDPNRPRWVNLSNQNERSFSYEDSVRFENNVALYLQDNVRGKMFSRRFNLGLGFRLNFQNGRNNPQPRVSFNYYVHKNWSLSTSYGISFKSPSLAHLYPAPTYFDIPLLNLYTGQVNKSLYLVYTQKVLAKNERLRNAVTYQFEQGVTFNSARIGNGSLFGYYKKNKNGFNTFSEFIPAEIPLYDYTLNEDGTIAYFPTGEQGKVWELKRSRMNNGLSSVDYGLQLSFQTKFVPVIATSFGLRAGYTVSKYTGGNLTTTELASDVAQQNGVVYVQYINKQRTSRESIVSFTTSTHIPKVGFIVNTVIDYQPLLKQRWEAQNIYPVAYTLYTGEVIVPSPEAARNDALAYLRKGFGEADQEQLVIPSKGFWNFNMRVAKEIKKSIRLSVSAFNVLNMKPKAYKISNNNGSDSVGIYNYRPLSITIGASLQL